MHINSEGRQKINNLKPGYYKLNKAIANPVADKRTRYGFSSIVFFEEGSIWKIYEDSNSKYTFNQLAYCDGKTKHNNIAYIEEEHADTVMEVIDNLTPIETPFEQLMDDNQVRQDDFYEYFLHTMGEQHFRNIIKDVAKFSQEKWDKEEKERLAKENA